MKKETIKKHILEIARRDLNADNIYYGVYDNYFPDEELLDFLATVLEKRVEMKVFYHCGRATYYGSRRINLELVKRKTGFDLGFYTYGKRHKKYFDVFFSRFFDHYCVPVAFETLAGDRFSFLDKITKAEIYDLVWQDIQFGIEHFECDYTPEFCQLITDYTNTEKVLKMIVMDAEGDYYVTESRIWAIKMLNISFWNFENTTGNWRTPDYIQQGHYMSFDRKIVQILDNQEVLYSSEPYSESEMAWRKHFLEDQVKAFCEVLKKKN